MKTVRYIGHKRAKIALQEIGSTLRRMYKSKRFGGELYLFALATYDKQKADSLAKHAELRGNKAQITRDGKLYLVWEHQTR